MNDDDEEEDMIFLIYQRKDKPKGQLNEKSLISLIL